MLRKVFYVLCIAVLSFNAYADESSLYQRLGGKPVLEAVIDQAMAKVAADPAVNQSFKGVNLKKLDAKIVDQICTLSGGDCGYKGDSMKEVHAGLNITEKELYALVEALREALDNHGVGEREKNELLKILAPMKRDVVTK